MNSKLVVLPLSPLDMVEFFKDKEQYHEIDVAKTLEDMSARSMLLYLSNLGIKCSFNEVTPEMMFEYMSMKDFVEAPMLMAIHANILQFLKYGETAYPAALEYFDDDAIVSFITEHENLVIEQAMFLDSFLLYIETRTAGKSTEVETMLDQGDINKDESTHDELGFSLLKLMQYEDFMIVYSMSVPPLAEQTYYTKYFDDYMFKGQNLFHYASSSPMFGMVKVLHDEQAVAG